jgi:hypothetical protein
VKPLVNIPKTTAIILTLMMASSIALIAFPAQAQTTYTNLQDGYGVALPAGVIPDVTLDTHPGLSVRPNPVGIGQTVLINMWINPPLHNARTGTRYSVTFTKPDGTTDVKDGIESYNGDTTAWFEYIVDQVGTWKVRFDFPGQYFPPGNYTSGQLAGFSSYGRVYSMSDSCYYAPSTTGDKELVVQQDQVMSWPPSALPTDYWTRPISPENRDWKAIAGNWPWPYANNYDYAGPFTIAPTTSHIVWKRQDGVAGLVGGLLDQLSIDTARGNTPSLIYSGRCYDTMTVPINGVPTSCAVCYDLRTGELYYSIPISEGGVTPTAISYSREDLPAVEGDIADLGPTVRLMSIGTTMKWIDPWDGSVIESCPGLSGTFYNDPYVLSVQNLGGGRGYRLINWTSENLIKAGGMTTIGTNQNFTERIISNVSYPFSSLGTCDFNAGIGVTAQSLTDDASGITIGTRLIGVSLISGQVLWNITTDIVNYSGSTAVADNGKYCFAQRDETAGQLVAWDLYSGNLAWKSDLIEWPWGFGGAYSVASAYGLVYRYSYPGVTAFNWTNGHKAWQFQAPAPPYETPYSSGVDSAFYAWDSGSQVADGKMYVANSEHSQSQPWTRGYRLFCINATSGEGIWNITGSWGQPGGVADGYLTAGNGYDGYMYVFGKGKSATTVTASPKTMSNGENVLIEGTVLDMSPAQPGTPCISKDSMTTYMEYLHMQHPIDGFWHNETVTGVPVQLLAIDSDGSVTSIGTATSDVSGCFQMAWTPPAEDVYKITATFAGDDSYGSSWAETGISVGPAPQTPETPQTSLPPDNTMLLYGILAAVVVAIVLALVAILVVLRKR